MAEVDATLQGQTPPDLASSAPLAADLSEEASSVVDATLVKGPAAPQEPAAEGGALDSTQCAPLATDLSEEATSVLEATVEKGAAAPPGGAHEEVHVESSAAGPDVATCSEQDNDQVVTVSSGVPLQQQDPLLAPAETVASDEPLEQEQPADKPEVLPTTAAQEQPESSGKTPAGQPASASDPPSEQAVEAIAQPLPIPASANRPAFAELIQMEMPLRLRPVEPSKLSQPMELSKEERALRGLLQFFVCADARRQTGGVAVAPLQMRYRELINAGYDVAFRANDQQAGSDALASAATPHPPAAAMDVDETTAPAAEFIPTPAEADTDPYTDVALDLEEGPASTGNLAVQLKTGMNKEQLRKQLVAKQQSLEREVQRLRRKRDLASQVVPPSSLEDSDDIIPVVVNENSDDVAMTPAAKPPPPPHPGFLAPSGPSRPPPPPQHPLAPPPRRSGAKRRAELPASRSDRDALLRRKLQDILEAEIEEERLQAKKGALEDLRGKLQKELNTVREERAKAAKLAVARQQESDRVQSRLKKALASSLELPLDDASLQMPASAGS